MILRKCQKFGDSLCVGIRQKKLFLPSTFRRSNSVTYGLAKLLTFYLTTRNRPLSKPSLTDSGQRPMKSQTIESPIESTLP